MPTGRALLSGLIALAALTPAIARAAPGDGFQVERYEVALRPDLVTAAISARQSVTLRATGTLSQVTFSPNALTIAGARADGASVPVRSEAEGITFTLPQPLAAGEAVTLSFTLQGTPRRGVEAVPGGLYTGYFACDWMVCLQDAPGDKAELELDLYLPRGTHSLGVGRLVDMAERPDGLDRHRWRTEQPASPYLFAFAAGDWAQVEQGGLHYLDATGSAADLPALFADTPAMASFFASRAGLDLPPAGYAQLLVPGSAAQETVSFSLIGQEELAAERDDPSSAWVIAHELAHQWWGNRITCATWRDFWLNEGLTTFMVAAWKQHRFGEATYQAELAGFRAARERLREQGQDRPLAWGGTYPSLGVRRAVQYRKGALFVAELRQSLGEAAFWRAIRRYTMAHDGGTVTSRDLQVAMEAASGRDLSALFGDWVYGSAEQGEVE